MKRVLDLITGGKLVSRGEHVRPEDVPELASAARDAAEIETSVALLRAKLEGLKATAESDLDG